MKRAAGYFCSNAGLGYFILKNIDQSKSCTVSDTRFYWQRSEENSESCEIPKNNISNIIGRENERFHGETIVDSRTLCRE